MWVFIVAMAVGAMVLLVVTALVRGGNLDRQDERE
jgi:uncharacterized membrane protein YvlD (DUF360 family)